jgi:hypothetical protein
VLAERHIILVGSPNTTEILRPNNVSAARYVFLAPPPLLIFPPQCQINGVVVVFRFVGREPQYCPIDTVRGFALS